ncbi:uncharacterized protein LOC123552487 [Mercenaria mercenaria]|uniref:uncharacterized protein LOC123552487 n=1 Tax=Mercenaria mercenaria TaxID=6596 RepID=UPI00234E8EF1|nr:uncharacterized protein LOC123552487 [Mercenaria mercenaria]
MAFWYITAIVILLFANLGNIGNARVIKSAKLTTEGTTNKPATGGTTTSLLPSNDTSTLKTKISSNPRYITTESPNATGLAVSENKILDLAFIMDTTGSMGSYIQSARQNIRTLVDEIAVNSSTDLRVALIEYRDHPPQDSTFVTRTHDFTSSVKTMKKWLKKAQARGGGDGPEAVAEGLYDVATKLSWRPEATKISVLISDAPPHGLVPWKDRSFPNGSPNGHDPVLIARDLTKREITLYTVGCEPAINEYKDFFMMLAFLTGGQYIPLSDPKSLIDAIIGGAQEEMSLQKFSKDVEEEIKKITAIGGTVNETSIAESVYSKLQKAGATSKQLLRNNKLLEGASDFAQSLASSVSLADVRAVYENRTHVPVRTSLDRRMHSRTSSPTAGFNSSFSVEDPSPYGVGFDSSASMSGTGLRGVGGFGSSASMSGAGELYSTAESAVRLDQIKRLVRQKASKLSGV